MKRLAAWFLWAGLAAGLRAEPVAYTSPEDRGRVVQREYAFEAAHGQRMTFALFVPTNYQPPKPAPLIVLLHGWGSSPWQVIHYLGIVTEAEKRGYIVVAPDGYNSRGGYGNHGPGRRGNWALGSGASDPPNIGELSEKDVLNVQAIVRREYAVDPKRVYLMGHSMGGGGTLYLGMKYPGRWAALAALSPAIYTDPEGLAAIRKTPIMVVQGELDLLVKAANTRRWVEKMKALKMDYRYIEVSGGDHFLSIAVNPAMIAQVFDFFDAHPK